MQVYGRCGQSHATPVCTVRLSFSRDLSGLQLSGHKTSLSDGPGITPRERDQSLSAHWKETEYCSGHLLRNCRKSQLLSAGQYPFSGLRETAIAFTSRDLQDEHTSVSLRAETFCSCENRDPFMYLNRPQLWQMIPSRRSDFPRASMVGSSVGAAEAKDMIKWCANRIDFREVSEI